MGKKTIVNIGWLFALPGLLILVVLACNGPQFVPRSNISPTDQPNREVTLVGQIGGAIETIVVQGEYAYLGVGCRLVVLDISTPVEPRWVGQSAPFPGMIRDLVVDGEYAYVADDMGGLRVVDISNPATPREVGFYDTPGYTTQIAVSDSFAYLVDSFSGLRVVNIANPMHPVEIGFYAADLYGHGLVISGKYGYVADFYLG